MNIPGLMRIAPKIQTAAFDVASWEVDAEFGFPQGARAKDAAHSYISRHFGNALDPGQKRHLRPAL